MLNKALTIIAIIIEVNVDSKLKYINSLEGNINLNIVNQWCSQL